MSFPFRLERVLSVRRIQEEAARQAHCEAQTRLQSARRALEEVRERKQQTLAALDDIKRRNELTTEALYLHTLHLTGLRREIEVAHLRVAQATVDFNRASSALSEAHKRCQSLERYRERAEFAWRKEQASKEAQKIDEIAVSHYRAREEESRGP